MMKKLLLALTLLAFPLQGKTIQFGAWEESVSYRIAGAAAKANFRETADVVTAYESQKEESGWQPSYPLKRFPQPLPVAAAATEQPSAKIPCSVHVPIACSIEEPCAPPTLRPCCSDLGFGAGAALIATAALGMLIPDCKTDPDSTPATPPPQTLQFNVRYTCGEIANTPTAEVVLPDMTIFQTYGIGVNNNFSNIINSPPLGTYNVNLTDVDNSETCFIIDVIVDSVTVITGAPFSGTAPNLTFNYTL